MLPFSGQTGAAGTFLLCVLPTIYGKRRWTGERSIYVRCEMSTIYGMEHAGEQARQVFPLSEQQSNIYRLEQRYPHTSIGIISGTLKITGKIDYELLERAVNFVLENDDTLRTRLTIQDGVPMQYIEKYSPKPVDFLDFSITGQEGLFQWDRFVTRTPFSLIQSDLYYFAIVKLSENRGGLFIKTHHLISDGWSSILLSNRITDCYQKLVRKQSLSPEKGPQYLKYLQASARYERSPRYESDRLFWERKMQNLPEKSALKDYSLGNIGIAGDRKTYVMPEETASLLRNYCAENNVTIFSLLLSALALYVHRLTGLDRMVFGVPILNRSTYEEKNTIGMFVSTIPMVVDVDEQMTFSEFNAYLLGEWMQILRHQRFPYNRILQIARSKNGPIERLFDITLSYQCSHFAQDEEGTRITHEGRWHYSGCQAEPICIHINERENDGRLIIDYDFLVQIFTHKEIEYVHTHVMNLLQNAIREDKSQPLYGIRLLGEEERERVLHRFNETSVPIPAGETVHGRILEQARKRGTDPAVVTSGERLSFDELAGISGRLAAALRRSGAQGVVGVLLERTARLPAAMVGVLEAGCALLLLDRSLPASRLAFLLQDAGVQTLVTDRTVLEEQKERGFSFGGAILCTEEFGEVYSPVTPPAATGRETAYVIYTSGTTGEPKGVLVSHRALLNFADGMRDYTGKLAALSMTTVSFDVFIMETLVPLTEGRTVVLAGESEQNDPDALGRLILHGGAGMLCLTPSRLRAYLSSPVFCAALGQIKAVVCGGETFPGDLLYRIRDCSRAAVYNQYGPSEATIGVTIKTLQTGDHYLIGKPMRNTEIYILDPHLNPVPIGATGEMYIGGACLADGYLGRPELTRERFIPHPFKEGERLYRTGDLARWYPRGEIGYLGRSDQQVKIRGFRVELGEIEARAKGYPGIRNAVAQVRRDQTANSYLCLYYVADAPVGAAGFKEFLSAYLPGYMVPSFFERMEEIPLTVNGKVDYKKLPEPTPVRDNAAYAAPSGLAETELAAIWSRQLGIDGLSADTNYFSVGGNSLSALEMLLDIHNTFDVNLTFTDVYNHPTIRGLSQVISNARQSFRAPILPAAVAPSYPLTPSQKRIYTLEVLGGDSLAYNMPGMYRVRGPLDVPRLERAFQTLIGRYEILRTVFVVEGAEMVQKVLEEATFSLERLPQGEPDEAFAHFVRPFDLARAPLLRAGVMRLGEEEYLLFVDQHHIVSDGRSGELFMEELSLLYAGKVLPPPRVQYKDYAVWLRKNERADWLESQRTYWLSLFEGQLPLLDFPTDRPRPAQPDHRGGRLSGALSGESYARISRFCRERGVSPYMYFLTVLSIALSRFTGQDDLIVGTPFSGRRQPEIENTLGAFINTLPLRLRVKEGFSFEEHLAWARERVLGALDNQDYPFDRLIDALHLEKNLSRNPLFDVLFVIQPFDASRLTLEGVELTLERQQPGGAKLDLFLEGTEREDRFDFTLEYATALFDEATVQSFLDCFLTLSSAASGSPETPALELPCLGPEAEGRLQGGIGYEERPFEERRLDALFTETAARLPEKTAVVFHGEEISYRRLFRAAGALAARLLEEGLAPGTPVAVVCRRSPQLLCALFAVQMAGCCYLPVDPAYPQKRKEYLLEDSRAGAVLLGEGEVLPEGYAGPVIPCAWSEEEAAFSPPDGLSQEDPVYILYTSGSTGRPKGVQVTHRNVANLYSYLKDIGLTEEEIMLCSTTVCFDVFVVEGVLSLCMGMTVALADEEEQRLPWRLAALMEQSGATLLQMTPSRFQVFLENEAFAAAAGRLHRVFLAGEALENSLLRRAQRLAGVRIWNLYGPTETTIYSTGADLTGEKCSHIGRPVLNTRAYVLDESLRLAPRGAKGELCIGGAGVSLGYYGRPELTGERFLQNPYAGGTLYRTGDIVRLGSDGNLQFVGRADHQIKYRGLRIELGEIEARMLETGLVREAVVTVASVTQSALLLRAAVIPAQGYDEKALLDHLKEHLPAYMVPASILPMERFPLTPSGKVDRKALAALPAKASPPEAPDALTPRGRTKKSSMGRDGEKSALDRLRAIWREVLGSDEEQISFFEQGGDSMAAIVTLTKYYALGFSMSVKEFYDHPTLAEQARLIDGTALPANQGGRRDFPARLPAVHSAPPALKNVLVTGASGFLGEHLLFALLQREDTRVICLSRAENALAHVLERYRAYFGAAAERSAAGRLEGYTARLAEERLGLPAGLYASLAERVDTVFHCAADVGHYGERAAFLRANLEATKGIIAFAREAGAHLAHCSTLSVSGSHLTDDPERAVSFDEDDLYIGQNIDNNDYVYSKFLAEAAVAEALAQGLSGGIHRIGHLTGRYSDGLFQRNIGQNALYLRLRSIAALGALPESARSIALEFTPVDCCAERMVALTAAGGTLPAFHLCAPQQLTLGEIAEGMGISLRWLPDEDFARLARESAGTGDGGALAGIIGDLLSPVVQRIRVDSRKTASALRNLGLPWPENDRSYLERLARHMRARGFLKE